MLFAYHKVHLPVTETSAVSLRRAFVDRDTVWDIDSVSAAAVSIFHLVSAVFTKLAGAVGAYLLIDTFVAYVCAMQFEVSGYLFRRPLLLSKIRQSFIYGLGGYFPVTAYAFAAFNRQAVGKLPGIVSMFAAIASKFPT